MSEDSFRLDDDEPDDEPGDEPKDESGLSQHPEAVRARERRAGGSTPKRRKKGGGVRRAARVPTSSEVTRRLHESLAALADALSERDPELSRVLHRDGPKMADLLGKWGDHPKTPPPVKVAVVVIAEILEPLRAFGGTVRVLLRRMRERRMRNAADLDELDREPDEPGDGMQVAPPVEPLPPERFRVDAEPPEVN